LDALALKRSAQCAGTISKSTNHRNAIGSATVFVKKSKTIDFFPMRPCFFRTCLTFPE